MTTRYLIRAGQCRSVESRSSERDGAHCSRPHRLPHSQVQVQCWHPPRTLARHAVHRIRVGLCGAVPDCSRRMGRLPQHRLRSSQRLLHCRTCRSRRLHLWCHPSKQLGVAWSTMAPCWCPRCPQSCCCVCACMVCRRNAYTAATMMAAQTGVYISSLPQHANTAGPAIMVRCTWTAGSAVHPTSSSMCAQHMCAG